jgi:hypothetical protein
MATHSLKRSDSCSSISPFSLEAPPKSRRREGKLSSSLSPPPHNQVTKGAVGGGLHDCHAEPKPLLNGSVKREIDLPKIYWGILYANVLGNVLLWAVICGFLVLPAVFCSFSVSRALNSLGSAGRSGLDAVQSISFLWFAGISSVCMVIGFLLIWREEIDLYVRSTNPLFL